MTLAPTNLPPSVEAMLNDARAATCTLEDWATACERDPNMPWRVGAGHLVNLLEEALDRLNLPAPEETTL